MASDKTFLWCVRAGEAGQADSVFLKKNYLAIGWEEMGDLSTIPATKEAFKAKIAPVYSNRKPGAIAGFAGMLYRFVHEMKPGDLVLYRSKIDKQFHVGEITGDYTYNPNIISAYPNVRPVKWLKSFPVTQFTQGATSEANSTLTVFMVRNYADEFISALAGETPTTKNGGDQTVAIVAKQIVQDTHDFIIRRLAQELKASRGFEEFVAHLLNVMGYRTRLTNKGADGGIDVVAHKDELGLEPPIIKVQVKSDEGSIGDPVVSALYGKVGGNEYGLLVTLGTFTKQAETFAREKSNLRLINGEELVGLILAHYERFDAKYKALIPLKQAYIPEALEEDVED